MTWGEALKMFLVTIGQAMGWFFTGVLKEKRDDAVEGEKAITEANQGTGAVDGMSRADKLHYLEKRGRVRSSESDH